VREVGRWGQSVIKERKEKFGARWSRKSLLEHGCVMCAVFTPKSIFQLWGLIFIMF